MGTATHMHGFLSNNTIHGSQLFGKEQPEAKVARVSQSDRAGDGLRKTQTEEPTRPARAIVARFSTGQSKLQWPEG